MRASSARSKVRQERASGVRTADVGWQSGIEFGERGGDDARVRFGEEDGEAAAFAGESVAVGVLDPGEEAVAA